MFSSESPILCVPCMLIGISISSRIIYRYRYDGSGGLVDELITERGLEAFPRRVRAIVTGNDELPPGGQWLVNGGEPVGMVATTFFAGTAVCDRCIYVVWDSRSKGNRSIW